MSRMCGLEFIVCSSQLHRYQRAGYLSTVYFNDLIYYHNHNYIHITTHIHIPSPCAISTLMKRGAFFTLSPPLNLDCNVFAGLPCYLYAVPHMRNSTFTSH
eukprot:1525958-Amphidinium_carterae.3